MPESEIEQTPSTLPEDSRPTAYRKLRDAWLVLIASAVIGLIAVARYDIPESTALTAFCILVLAILLTPQRAKPAQPSLAPRREIGRVWPGTGMKVTVDALSNPCVIADGKGVTRYMNAAAEKTFGVGRVGDPLSFSLRAPSLLEAFDRVATSASSERIVWMEKVPTEAWYEASLAPIYLPGNRVAAGKRAIPDFVLVVIADMTEQRRLERMRTDFVANASHELRTPLASLAGFIETLQGPAKDDPDARERFLSIMFEQAGRMRRLIDDILSLSRIELKAHVKPDKDVDLVEVVRHTADAMAPLARELDMEISVEFPETSVLVKGDRDELIQVAENLVENALKYGMSGKRVEVCIASDPTNQSVAGTALSVRDYGEGIASEHLPRLTERFYRVDVDSSRAMKGTGLGLAIVKHILARHRARLDVNSTPGKGSTFTVEFP